MNNTLKEIKSNPMTKVVLNDEVGNTLYRLLQHADSMNDYWGELYPLMACEEMAELEQAISKKERGNTKDNEDLINEMGDVIIAISILASRYQIPYKDIVSRVILKIKQIL